MRQFSSFCCRALAIILLAVSISGCGYIACGARGGSGGDIRGGCGIGAGIRI